MVRKLAIRGLRRGIGSMDYIHTLLIMEDDLDEENEPVHADHTTFTQSFSNEHIEAAQEISPSQPETASSQPETSAPPYDQPERMPNTPNTQNSTVDWCKCGHCRPMPQAIENKCCRQKNCITLTTRFAKLCLDVDVLELCLRNMRDIRNDREDNSTRSFRKAAYRQFIQARHGYLGKGNRRVCPSCVVLKIREKFPSITGIYMGYRDH